MKDNQKIAGTIFFYYLRDLKQMTVTELAQKLNVTPDKIFEYFDTIQKPIPHDLEYELSEELLSNVINSKNLFQ